VFKLIIFIIVIFICYFIFFKKDSKSSKKEIESLVECKKCQTFISVDDAILKDGEYFCSKECMK
jgi:uncharacterized protein